MDSRLNWSWNEKQRQPEIVRSPSERRLLVLSKPKAIWRFLWSNLAAWPSAWRRYPKLARGQPEDFFGIFVTPVPRFSQELFSLVEDLGVRQVGIRFLLWDDQATQLALEWARRFKEKGCRVLGVLTQNRELVVRPCLWRAAAGAVLEQGGDCLDWVEIGRAYNRTKWGVWEVSEYERLVEEVFRLREDLGVRLPLLGPAAIDFEYHYLPPILWSSKGFCFDALTHLLYVDRRGAPEKSQWGFFDLERKIRWLKALAEAAPRTGSRVWITEVNWPVAGYGDYMPAHAGVDERTYADYLVRYHVIALATGCVEKVFWWELEAPGYGLVDSLGGKLRPRRAYFAYQHLVRTLGGAAFVSHRRAGGARLYLFRCGSERVAVAWSEEGGRRIPFPSAPLRVETLAGDPTDSLLLPEPKYFHLAAEGRRLV